MQRDEQRRGREIDRDKTSKNTMAVQMVYESFNMSMFVMMRNLNETTAPETIFVDFESVSQLENQFYIGESQINPFRLINRPIRQN